LTHSIEMFIFRWPIPGSVGDVIATCKLCHSPPQCYFCEIRRERTMDDDDGHELVANQCRGQGHTPILA